MSEQENPQQAPARPVLRVVNPDATPEEIAALTAVFAALSASGGAEATRPVSGWTDRSRALRRPLPHGPGAWRASAWPR